MSSPTIKVATTDCGDIEIQTTANIKTSEFIKGYLDVNGYDGEYIDYSLIGHQNLTANQVRRFYAVWEFLTSPAGQEYCERVNIDYWQYRNFRLDDCLDQPLKDAMKSTPEERAVVMADLARATTISYEELETNEHTKEFLDNGYVSFQYVAELMNYSNFLGIDSCIRLFAGCFAGHLKRLVKVFPIPPPTNSPPDDGLSITEGGFVEEIVVSMVTSTVATTEATDAEVAVAMEL